MVYKSIRVLQTVIILTDLLFASPPQTITQSKGREGDKETDRGKQIGNVREKGKKTKGRF